MLKIKGIKNGAVLQRDDNNFCKITLIADFVGTPETSFGKLSHIENNKWELSDIYIGGPYAITIKDDVDSATFSDVYVGDLWLLAGQSNMEGAGKMTVEDDYETANTVPFIRAFYMNDVWDNAKPIVHHLYLSEDIAHKNTWQNNVESIKNRGIILYDDPPYNSRRNVGPGYFFAKEMFKLTDGVPQGLIPAAVGGAPIEKWLPSEEENYYSAACRRIEETGSNIRGIFWAQGEGNSNYEIYLSQIESIRADLSKRLGKDIIPFVQMQSFKCTLSIGDKGSDMVWSRFREMQRKMPFNAEYLATIATNDLELEDCIHLSSYSQKIAGVRGARAMYYLITGCGFAEPQLDKIYLKPERYIPQIFTEIHIRYKNISGSLKSSGVPCGFALRKKGDEVPSIKNFRKISIKQNEVIISVEIPIDSLSEYELWYGYGNEFYCNITDGENRSIPAMGPISICEKDK